jgi:hypothetical protein
MARSSGRFYFFSALVYLVLVWFLSGLVRTGGLFLVGAGALALAGCLGAARRGRRWPLFALYLSALMLAALAGSLEGLLWLAPRLLRGSVANHAYSGYHCLPGGIYRRDCHLGYALKPGLARAMCWNGHWWRHETNAAGYRGAAVEQADVVFLGDSMVYGHGVANEETVPSQFAERTSRTVANLGQQGTCLIQMWIRQRRIGIGLRPRIVFVCSHPNDIGEASDWYPEEELRRFVAAAPEEGYEPSARRHFWPKPWWRLDHHLWDARLALPLWLGGALAGWRKALADGSLRRRGGGDSAGERPFVPSAEALREPFAPWAKAALPGERLGWQAHCRALVNLKSLCARHGAQLVAFDLGYPHAFSRAIEEEARRLGVPYSPAGRVALQRSLAGADVYLAADGHWSANGCGIVAGELARFVSERTARR